MKGKTVAMRSKRKVATVKSLDASQGFLGHWLDYLDPFIRVRKSIIYKKIKHSKYSSHKINYSYQIDIIENEIVRKISILKFHAKNPHCEARGAEAIKL